MPDWFIHESVIAGRIVAGFSGCVCFYLAFFLYEDEEGIWQNRLEMLWLAVYERAKATDNTTTALFNRLASALIAGLNRLFGQRLLTLQGIIVSANLSLWVGLAFDGYSKSTASFQGHPIFRRAEWLVELLLSAFFFAITLLAARYPRRWVVALTAIPALAFIVWLPIHSHDSMDRLVGRAFLAILSLSILSDYLCIALIRVLLSSLSQTLSILKVILSLAMLTLFGWVITSAPGHYSDWLGWQYARHFHDDMMWDAINEWGQMISQLNVSTALLCVGPIIMCGIVLFHKLFWPLLSRLIYPLIRNKTVTNRKALIAVGTLALTFALNFQHAGLKELLKLFS